MKTYYKCTPKNGGEPYVKQYAPDTWEECFGEEVETDQSIAADAYWHIAEIINTQEGWSVQEHVQWMRELLDDCLRALGTEHHNSSKVMELRQRVLKCLQGTAPGYLKSLWEEQDD